MNRLRAQSFIALGVLATFVTALVVWAAPAVGASGKPNPCKRYKHNPHAYKLCLKKHHLR